MLLHELSLFQVPACMRVKIFISEFIWRENVTEQID